jgi:ATP-dependent Clp protease ATP-binding subunit ClpC
MQILYHRLTRRAKNVFDELTRTQGENLKKIKAGNLIQILEKEKGSLGKIIVDNLSLTDKILRNKKNIEINFFDVLSKAFKLAAVNKSYYVGTEHLIQAFLSLLTEKQRTLSLEIFSDNNKPSNKKRKSYHSNFSGPSVPPEFFGEINSMINNFLSPGNQKSSPENDLLKNFCTDLNAFASKNKHLLIGRDKELERISNILGRKMKNNPVLIGDPGVGKTAIVEGLAQKINEGKAPFYLGSKKIYSLDLGLLVAGTNFRGEFESRLKEIINEAKENRNIILFIDELHNLVGAGGAIGGMDAANLLKPALSRGEIQIIGATTFDEYQKHIGKDAALERRFQPITIKEPSPQEATDILTGIKKNYEEYHNISIDNEAILSSVALAKNYITGRFLPDSAIDLIDEAAAKLRAGSASGNAHHILREKENHLEEIIERKELLVLSDHYEEALRIKKIEEQLKNDIAIMKKELLRKEKIKKIHLTEKDVQKTLAESLNVPEDYILKENRNIPNQVKKDLQKNLFGQNHVIKKIHNSLLRQFSGIGNSYQPLGSFLFIGPSGVGKTFTAKILSSAISPFSQDNLIQINMSEFMEKHSVSRLLGAPAGYVGYEEGGELLDKIRHNPYSVVLFDEIEKAEQTILNILLQILDEGRITNAKGQIIDFKNTIIILTSNIGNARLNEISKIGFEQGREKALGKLEMARKNIEKEIEETLPLELINRLDDILIFNYLTEKNILQAVRKELEVLSQKGKDRGWDISFDPRAEKLIAKMSLSPDQGARLINRQIKDHLEPLIAQELIKKRKSKNKKEIKISVYKNKLSIQK